MRLQRWQWLARFFSPVPTGRPRERKRGSGRPRDRYTVEVNGTVHEVAAYTAGEARAAVKKTLGLDRLPVGILAVKQ